MTSRDARDDLIDELRRQNAALTARVEELLKRVAVLEEKLRKGSRNSSKPPSSDGPQAPPRRKKKSSGKRPGGQPGHPRRERALVPQEEVDKLIKCRPEHCGSCGLPSVGEDPTPRRHQVFELPVIRPRVTEYELHTTRCTCGASTSGQLPAGVPTGCFGPTVTAAAALLMGVFRLSKRAVPELMLALFGLSMSVGAVVGCQEEASAALEVPVEEGRVAAVAAPIKHADETGWREARGRAWLWTMVTSTLTIFLVQPRRNAEAARALLGEPKGVLVTDRHGAYGWWKGALHQFCWAHLLRDFTAIEERGGYAGGIGTKLLAEAGRMFHWWHRVRDGTLSFSTFQVYMRSVRRNVEQLLAAGERCLESRTARTCRRLLKYVESLWTFVREPGVEPTNNVAERAVRHPVLWRRMSHGTHSKRGSVFVARIFTVHASLRQQKRDVLSFIRDACAAKLTGSAPPSLVPVTV